MTSTVASEQTTTISACCQSLDYNFVRHIAHFIEWNKKDSTCQCEQTVWLFVDCVELANDNRVN